MSSPLRFGVIGAGAFAARRHIPDIVRHPDATLSAICRRDPVALEKLREHFNPERTYTDWKSLLEECPLDAVVIATPHDLHFAPTLAALEKGLHVLLEKPMTIRSDEARRLRDVASERGLSLAIALNPPYWAHCHAMRRAIQNGQIGEVESVSLYWTGNSGVVFGDVPMSDDTPGPIPPTLFRADADACGGGHFIDGGAHLVSELLWVTGQRATQVSCVMDRTPSDRRAALAITLESGTIATINSIGNSQSGRRVRNIFGGSRGTIAIDGFDFRTTIERDSGDSESFKEADMTPVPGPVANLIDSIVSGAKLSSDADHGVHVTEVLEAAYLSAQNGSSVTLPLN